MAISEQIKVLCVRSDISVAELTRRIGTTPQDLLEMTCLSVEEPFWFAEGCLVSPLSAPLKHVLVAERDENDPEQRLGTVLNVILAEFEKLGYKTIYGLLDAVNYGVPQFRERFVLIGSRDNEGILKMIPEGGSWRDLPTDIIPVTMGGAYKSGGGKVGFYRSIVRCSFSTFQPLP